MRLSDLQSKDIVNINDGKRVGRIIDADITLEGVINYLVIEERKGLRNFISQNAETNVNFSQIKRIGTDVILVDLWYNTSWGVKWIKKYLLLHVYCLL